MPPTPSIAQDRLDEMKNLYISTFAPAIDKFLEVQWYTQKSLPKLVSDNELLARFSLLVDWFMTKDPENFTAQIQSMEANVFWSFMDMPARPRGTQNGAGGQDSAPEMPDEKEAAAKITILEALITGQHLEENPISPPSPPERPGLQEQIKGRAGQFWHSMGRFLTLQDNDAVSALEIDRALSTCRGVLDNFENRDVIYSIAIVRHLSQRFQDFPRSIPQPKTNEEKDAEEKISVAKKFLEDEAQGRGTTQIIQRVCGMAIRAWYVG
jgi:white-opaque regulator 2